MRLDEHRRDEQHKKMSTALAQHLTTTNHSADFENVKILDIEHSCNKRLTLESLRIQQQMDRTVNFKEDKDNTHRAYATLVAKTKSCTT